jgi:hypothetical protein
MPGYISEVDYDGGANDNFVEVVVPAGTDVSSYTLVVYKKDGTLDATLSFDPLPAQTIAGSDVYLFDSADPNFPDIKNDEAIALVDDPGTVIQFISFKDPVTAIEGPANGMSATQVGEHSGGEESLVTGDGGSSYSTTGTSTPGTIPCFAPGTMIDTPNGPRTVEILQPGDMVLTRDNGPQAIRWTRSGDHPLENAETDAKPVQIKAGALGQNLPAQDLIISPQHRILVGGAGQLESVFASEAFAPAKSLTSLPGIRHMRGKTQITWVHFACERHEVVCANGCWTESPLLGPMVMQSLSGNQRRALYGRFFLARMGSVKNTSLNGPPARRCLKVCEAHEIISRNRFLARCAA